MATARQIAANQANAARSTGPRTDEGKARARRNALTHGLTGAGDVLTPDDQDAVDRRLAEWADDFPVDTPARAWLLRRLVVMSVRLDDCAAHQDALRAYHADRARSDGWTVDRRAEAEDLAAALARRPARTVAALARTRHGCDWLVTRWRSLADAAASGTPWDDAQRRLALDLLGTPPELRNPDQLLDPAEQAGLASRELQRLERLMTGSLDRLDEVERSIVTAGHHVCPDREVLRLQRYEAACLREFYRTLNELMAPSPAPTPCPEPGPGPDPAPDGPTPTPEAQAAPRPARSALETLMLSRCRERIEAYRWSQIAIAPVTSAPATSPDAADSPIAPEIEDDAPPSRPMNRRARRAAQKLAASRR